MSGRPVQPRAVPYNTPPPEPEPDPVDEGHDLRMGFFEHLKELRQRLTRAFLAVIVGTVIGFVFAGDLLDYMRQPYCNVVPEATACELATLSPTDGVIVFLRVSLMVGGILAIPMMTYQLMMFVLPGLTRKEKRMVILSLPPITFLFVIGVMFAWFLLIPPALEFLESFQADLFRTEWTADHYMGFVTALIFWMGVAFESPLVFFVLSLLGLITPRPMMRQWRLAVVGAAIAAAMITPTIDPVNMFLVMGPLLTLYALSIVLVGIGARINRAGAT